jgi:hypothetical protein
LGEEKGTNNAQDYKALLNEKLELDREVGRLKRELTKVQEELARAKRGGRYKDYAKENQVVNYKQANLAATVREIAKALGISTTTVQKALVANGLNKQRGKGVADMRAISKRKFVEDWIEKTFEPGAVSFSWQDGKAIVKDGNGEEMIVELRDRTLYADGKPYGGIPSLVDVVD